MKTLLLLLLPLFLSPLKSQCTQGPYVGSTNFTADLKGDLDTRGSTWGTAEAHTWQMSFMPPPGYTTRILAIEGSVDAHTTNAGAPTLPPPGTFVGVLGAVASVPPDYGWSNHANFLSNQTFTYKQGLISWRDGVTAFRINTPPGFDRAKNTFLGPEEILYFTVAKYLDATHASTHMELTATIVYEFVKRECIE